MKKIMFNDKFQLTNAVLEGGKTQTRRLIKCRKTFKGEWVAGFNIHIRPSEKKVVGLPCMYDADESEFDGGEILPKYNVGEVVAVAQSYKDMNAYYSAAYQRQHSIHGMTVDALDCVPDEDIKKWFKIRDEFKDKASWNNKMFVKPEYMPHQIRITDVRVEKLQDISDEDCLREGIVKDNCKTYFNGYTVKFSLDQYGNMLSSNWFKTPREAFAHLINKVSRKDVWSENPYVFVYDFELVK